MPLKVRTEHFPQIDVASARARMARPELSEAHPAYQGGAAAEPPDKKRHARRAGALGDDGGVQENARPVMPPMTSIVSSKRLSRRS